MPLFNALNESRRSGSNPGAAPPAVVPTESLCRDFSGQQITRGQVTNFGDEARSLQGLRTRVNASISNAPNRAAREAGIAGGTAVQQQFGDNETGAVTHGDVLNNALKRAKTRVGIANRGEAAARNQQLKDRLVQVRSGIARKASAIDTQVQGRNIMAGVNVGVGDARARGSAAMAGAFGGAAGAFAGTLAGNKKDGGGFFDFKLGGHSGD